MARAVAGPAARPAAVLLPLRLPAAVVAAARRPATSGSTPRSMCGGLAGGLGRDGADQRGGAGDHGGLGNEGGVHVVSSANEADGSPRSPRARASDLCGPGVLVEIASSSLIYYEVLIGVV